MHTRKPRRRIWSNERKHTSRVSRPDPIFNLRAMRVYGHVCFTISIRAKKQKVQQESFELNYELSRRIDDRGFSNW